MRNLLILCYFLFILICVSCRNTKKEEVVTITDDKEVSKSSESTNTKDKKILFFGDSLTAGMGLSIEEAYPSIIQEKLDSLGLSYQVINAGLSGETTAGGKNRLDWVLNQNIDIFVLELGANDGLRGVPLTETRKNLQAIIDLVKNKNPRTEIVLAGMQIPPNLGQDYTEGFNKIFPELAVKNNLKLIPFLLKNVAGIPELNQNDGIHPTAEGHKILAENTWFILKDII